MRIHGVAINVPRTSSDRPDRTSRLWQALADANELSGLSPASLSPVLNFAYRLYGWVGHAPSDRFGQVNLRPEVFDLRSDAVTSSILTAPNPDIDVVLQEGFFFSPQSAHKPYAVYIDGTGLIVSRHYPSQCPWTANEGMRKNWLQREYSLYHNAVRVFCYSEFCRRSVISDYGIREDKVSTIYPGANRQADVSENMRKPHQVLFVGYDFKRKGGSKLLEAWLQVRRSVPGAELNIVGPVTGPSHYPPGVNFVGKVTNPAQLAELYASASVFCMPSLFEAYGHVFIEAMSAGLPCIGPSAFAAPEIITAGKDGLLVEPGSVDEIADALIRILSDQRLLQEMSHAARLKASSWPTWGEAAASISNQLNQDLVKATP